MIHLSRLLPSMPQGPLAISLRPVQSYRAIFVLFVFRVEDVTDLDIVINQNHDIQGGYYIIATSTLSNGSIDVSVTDEFQRNTSLSLPILAVNSTTFDASGSTGNEGVKTFCLEEAGSVMQREVVLFMEERGRWLGRPARTGRYVHR